MKRERRHTSKEIVFTAKSVKETKKTAALLAEEILKKELNLSHALVIGLIGELGSGKTAFAQGFAKGLGVKARVLSPTFVLMRAHALTKKAFKTFIHIDCYRLNDQEDLISLGWHDLVKNPQNLILIEWADRIRDMLPPHHIILSFCHENEITRTITITEAINA